MWYSRNHHGPRGRSSCAWGSTSYSRFTEELMFNPGIAWWERVTQGEQEERVVPACKERLRHVNVPQSLWSLVISPWATPGSAAWNPQALVREAEFQASRHTCLTSIVTSSLGDSYAHSSLGKCCCRVSMRFLHPVHCSEWWRGHGVTQHVSLVRLTSDCVPRAVMKCHKILAQLSKSFAHLVLASHQLTLSTCL